MEADGVPIDIITTRDYLIKTGRLDASGGETYLSQLGMELPDPSRITVYAKSVQERALTERIYELAGRLSAMKEDGNYNLEQLLEQLGGSYETMPLRS